MIAAMLGLLFAAAHARVDGVFKQYELKTVPGCALGIFHNGTIAYARGYGMADLEHGIPITPASLFDVGSVSKQFAAAAIALLVDRGKLSFTDDVRKYIPELPVYGAPITLNELMWHTSGLRDYTDLLDLAGYGLEQATTDEEALALITRQRGLEFPSGTRYEYSNTNYFLLSVIVKRVTGQTLAAFVRHNIFLPLGMTHTVYRTDYAMLIRNRAMGYAPAGRGQFKNSMSNWQQTGDGAVQLSIDDAAKWDENFYHPRVGGKRLVEELQTPGHLSSGTKLQYARGLFIGTYRGLRSVTHGGAWIGYRAAFDRYPDVHTSIVVLCNSDAASPETLAQRVADIVLKPHLAPVAATATYGRHSTIASRNLTGSYLDQVGGDVFHVVAQGAGIELEAGGNPYPLTPAGGSSFRLGSTIVQFQIGKDGTATAMRLDGGGESGVYAQRFTPVVPTAADLAGIAGSYYSSELDVTWRLVVKGRNVAIEPARNLPEGAAGDLHPQIRDAFTSDGGFLIRLARTPSGEVSGFSLSAGRGLRSVAFTRVR